MGGRGSSSGKRESSLLSRMTASDRYYLKDAEDHVANQDRQIPEYMRYGMTKGQIRAEVIKHVHEEGILGINGTSVRSVDVDGRFPKPQNSRYDKLVEAMNGIDLSKVNTSQYGRERTSHSRGRSWDEDYFEQTVERLTSGYSTKELGEFVRNELKITGYYSKGGRPNYTTAIELALHERFIKQGSGGVMRNRLSDPTSRLGDFVSSMSQALSLRETYRERAQEIRAKYRRSKK